MRVDATMLGLVFSAIGTLVVIVGAIAALRQLAHLRHGNELAAIGKFVDEWSSPDFTADRMFVLAHLDETMRDPGLFDRLREDPRSVRILRVAHFFERLAFFVRRGAISEDLAMEFFAAAAIMHWDVLREFVVRLRAVAGAQAPMEWFEDFAMRAPEWAAKNERKSKGLRRDPQARFRGDQPAEPAIHPRADEGLAAPET